MALICIPQTLTKMGELVIIPRSDYEEYLNLKKIISIVKPNAAEKKAIKDGRKEVEAGNYFTIKELKNELAG